VGVGWCIWVGGFAGVGESVRTIESVRVCEGEEREKIGLSAMLKSSAGIHMPTFQFAP